MANHPARSQPYLVYESQFARLMALANLPHAALTDVTERTNELVADATQKTKKLIEAKDKPILTDDQAEAIHKQVEDVQASLKEQSELLEVLKDTLATYRFLHIWMIPILVAITEVYLEEVFSILITEPLATSSLPPDAIDDIRTMWTKQNIRRAGNPHTWITKLEKFGASGYTPNIGDEMRKIWERRHQLIHKAPVEAELMITKEFLQAANVVSSFVEITDAFVVSVWANRTNP